MEPTVLDARTGDVISCVPIAGESACDGAVERARESCMAWARTPPAERAGYLSDAAAAVRAAAEDMAELNGRKPVSPHRTLSAACRKAWKPCCSTRNWVHCIAEDPCKAVGLQRI
jgi:acyl-CoA reductase-like NAD-dependent aldehyde dehydrogenase